MPDDLSQDVLATIQQYIEWDIPIGIVPKQALAGDWKQFMEFCDVDYFTEAEETHALTLDAGAREALGAQLTDWLQERRKLQDAETTGG